MLSGVSLAWLAGEGIVAGGHYFLGLPRGRARWQVAGLLASWLCLGLGPALAPLFTRAGAHLHLDILGKIQWPGHEGFVSLNPGQYLYLLWAGPWLTLPWFGLLGWGVWHKTRQAKTPGNPAAIRWPVLLGWGFVFFLGLSVWTTTVYPVTGDEPHYLLVAHSLTHEHDLDLTDNMARKDFQRFYPGAVLDFHGAPAPDGKLVSKHFPALAFLLAPGYWLLGRFGAALFILLCAAGIAAVLFTLARLWGASEKQALLVWFLALVSPPLGTYFDLIYTELPAAFLLSLALLGYVRGKTSGVWELALGAGALAWLYPKYFPFSLLLALALPLSSGSKPRDWFAAYAVLACLGLGYYYFYKSTYSFGLANNPYGTFHPFFSRASLQNFLGLLVDRDYGLFSTVPVLGLSLAGMAAWKNLRGAWFAVVLVASQLVLYTLFVDFTGTGSILSRYLAACVPLLFALLPWGWAAVAGLGKWARGLFIATAAYGAALSWLSAACPVLRYLSPKQKLWAALGNSFFLFPSLAAFPTGKQIGWALGWVMVIVLGLFWLLQRNNRKEEIS
jgi:hypothetical protein